MLSFGTQTGNLFPRLGKLALLIKQMRSYQLAQYANMTDATNGVVAQYDSESDIQALIGSTYISNLATPESIAQTAQSIAQQTINRMVFRDNPQISQTLQSLNVNTSIQEVIRQMKLQGATVLTQTITATPGVFVGYGNGVLVFSTIRPSDGVVLEHTLSETLTATCVQDSYSGGAIAGNESIRITGTGNQSDLFAFNWPLGSNAQAQTSAVSPSASNNILANSDFTTWNTDSNVPDKFTLVTGVSGVNTLRETGLIYGTSPSALKIVGDGSTKVSLTQQFGVSTGTPVGLRQSSQFSFNIFLRMSGAAITNGVLTIDWIDRNGTVIQDAAGRDNSVDFTLSNLNTVYSPFNVSFRTPIIMPDTMFIRYRLSTALNSGSSIYLARSTMGVMQQIYANGPYVCCHSGGSNFVIGDYSLNTITNSRGVGGTQDTWQTAFMKLLNPFVLSNGYLLPSSNTPNISDNLIG